MSQSSSTPLLPRWHTRFETAHASRRALFVDSTHTGPIVCRHIFNSKCHLRILSGPTLYGRTEPIAGRPRVAVDGERRLRGGAARSALPCQRRRPVASREGWYAPWSRCACGCGLALFVSHRMHVRGVTLLQVPTKGSNFITHSSWKVRPFWQRLRALLPVRCGVLAIDDTGLPTQGKVSVGVHRQYCGALGKVANCQVADWHRQCGTRSRGPGGPRGPLSRGSRPCACGPRTVAASAGCRAKTR